MSISNATIQRAAVNGVVLGVVESFRASSEKSAMEKGITMAGASVVSDLVVNQYVSVYTPAGVPYQVLGDGITYSAIRAFKPQQRSGRKFLTNFLVAAGSSWAGSWILSSGRIPASLSAQYSAEQASTTPARSVPVPSGFAAM